MLGGDSRAALLRAAKLVGMILHADPLAGKGDALGDQAKSLFQAGFPGEENAAAGADDPMPRRALGQR